MDLSFFVSLIWSLFIPFLTGFALLSFFSKGKELDGTLQRTSLSFFIGTSIFTLILFLLSIFKISWDPKQISLIVGFLSLIILMKNISTKTINLKKFFNIKVGISLVNILLILIIIFKFFTIFYISLDKPIFNFDAWSNWSLRAKVFYFEKGIPQNPDSSYFLGGGGHINYPLQIPILEAWTYTILGSWNDQAVKVIFPLYLLFFTLFLYSFLSKHLDSTKSLLLSFIFISLPFVGYHASADYVDLPAGLYIGLATMLLFNFLQTKNYFTFLLAILMFSFSAWIKNEGLLIFFLSSLLLLVYQFKINEKKIINTLKILFTGFIFLAPWTFFKIYSGLGVGISNLGSNSLSANYSLHFEVIPIIFKAILNTSNYSLLWLSFFVGLIFLRKIDIKNIGIMALFAVSYLVFFIGIYLFTGNYIYILDGTILERNLLIIAPSVFWITSLMWGKYFKACD